MAIKRAVDNYADKKIVENKRLYCSQLQIVTNWWCSKLAGCYLESARVSNLNNVERQYKAKKFYITLLQVWFFHCQNQKQSACIRYISRKMLVNPADHWAYQSVIKDPEADITLIAIILYPSNLMITNTWCFYQHFRICAIPFGLKNSPIVFQHQTATLLFLLVYVPGEAIRYMLSLVVRKRVFGVSDQVRHKPGCTVTKDG